MKDILASSSRVDTASYVRPLLTKFQQLLARAAPVPPFPAPGTEVQWLEALVSPPQALAPAPVPVRKEPAPAPAPAPAAPAPPPPDPLTSELLGDFVVHAPRLTAADVDAELARCRPTVRL